MADLCSARYRFHRPAPTADCIVFYSDTEQKVHSALVAKLNVLRRNFSATPCAGQIKKSANFNESGHTSFESSVCIRKYVSPEPLISGFGTPLYTSQAQRMDRSPLFSSEDKNFVKNEIIELNEGLETNCSKSDPEAHGYNIDDAENIPLPMGSGLEDSPDSKIFSNSDAISKQVPFNSKNSEVACHGHTVTNACGLSVCTPKLNTVLAVSEKSTSKQTTFNLNYFNHTPFSSKTVESKCLSSVRKRKLQPDAQVPSHTGDVELHDKYIQANIEKLMLNLEKSQTIVAISSVEQAGLLQSNTLRICQISFIGDQAGDRWDNIAIPLRKQPVGVGVVCYRTLLLKCFEKGVLCSDSKVLMSQLLAHSYLMTEEIASSKIDDVSIAEWLLNPDMYESTNQLSASSSHTVFQQEQLAGKLRNQFVKACANLQAFNLLSVYNLEIALVPILVNMEFQGLCVNAAELDRLDLLMKDQIEQLEKRASTLAGGPILLNSHAQLRQVLFEQLKLDKLLPNICISKTEKIKEKSTSEVVLQQLAAFHPFPAVVLEYRQIHKVHSTCVTSMKGFVTNGTVKACWDQKAASTGRLQSNTPNMQALPKTCAWKNSSGEEVSISPRSIFCSKAGFTFISADFRQIELRLLAHMCGDKNLLKAFDDHQEDIFRKLSSIWLKKKLDDVDNRDRERTKRVVYAVTYGVGKVRLAEFLQVTPMEAQSIMTRFLKYFPGINQFIADTSTKCRERGFVTSIVNRRRLLPNIKHKDFKERARAERQAVNFAVQGSAADICKIAMVRIAEVLRGKRLDATILVQMHDELLLEVRDDCLSPVKELLKMCLETDKGDFWGGIQLDVPMRIAMKFGKNWADMIAI